MTMSKCRPKLAAVPWRSGNNDMHMKYDLPSLQAFYIIIVVHS